MPWRANQLVVPFALLALSTSSLFKSSSTTLRIARTLCDQILVPFALQERIVRHLNLPVHPESAFSITVDNGETLQCIGICPQVPVILSDTSFLLDLYVLPLHGANLILGVQWLQTLGLVTFDYSKMSISFSFGSRAVTLQGGPPSELHSIQLSQVKCGLSTGSFASFYHLALTTSTASATSPSTHPHISTLLVHFADLFATPTGLPLCCQFDHRIHLLPRSLLVNVKPYH